MMQIFKSLVISQTSLSLEETKTRPSRPLDSPSQQTGSPPTPADQPQGSLFPPWPRTSHPSAPTQSLPQPQPTSNSYLKTLVTHSPSRPLYRQLLRMLVVPPMQTPLKSSTTRSTQPMPPKLLLLRPSSLTSATPKRRLLTNSDSSSQEATLSMSTMATKDHPHSRTRSQPYQQTVREPLPTLTFKLMPQPHT